MSISVLAWATLLAVQPARADIGVVGVDPGSGTRGETVTVSISCGGCQPGGFRLPVSLVRFEDRPLAHPCGPNALCEERATGPPKDPPFAFLGRTSRTGRLQIAIPDLRPGVYAFVVYCATCYRGPGGSMIAGDEPYQRLRIRRGRAPRVAFDWVGGILGSVRAILAAAEEMLASLAR
jgi:hypothetical protein